MVEQEHLARPRRELIADALGLESHFFERSESRGISWWERIAYQERASDAFERTVEAHMLPTNRLGQFMDRATVVTLPFGVVREAQPLLQGTRAMALQSTRAGVQMAGSVVRGSAVSLLTTGQEVAQSLRFPSLRFANALAGEARVTSNEVAALRGSAAAARPITAAAPLREVPLFDIHPQAVNGNSLAYVGDTHVYIIRDADGTSWKIGQSMRGTNKLGLSKRAQGQVRKILRKTDKVFRSNIRRTFSTKAEACAYETKLIERFRRMFGPDSLPGNKGNR